MRDLPMWRRYLRFVGPDMRGDLEEEIRFHLEMRVDELVALGMDPARAREEAERRFGDMRRLKAECMEIGERTEREQVRKERWGIMVQEARQSVRGLLRNPGFALVAILTLGLGIGATTAIYGLLEAVVLRPLPYPESDRLVSVGNAVPGMGEGERWGLSPAGYFHFTEHGRTLDELGIYTIHQGSVTSDGPAERVDIAAVSSSLFSALRPRPALGRLLTAADDRPATFDEGSVSPGPAEMVVVLSHHFWRRRYGVDPEIVGKTIQLSGIAVPVVGVLPRGFGLPDQPVDVWVPLGLNPNGRATNWHTFSAIGRLADGVDPETAERELAGFTASFPEVYPSAYSDEFMESTGFTPDVVLWRDLVVGEISRTLWILLSAVGLVLLIAAANVANLFLVRAEARQREIAIRSALGASGGRLAGLFVAEGLVVGLLGGLLGLFLAYGGMRMLVRLAPEGLPRLAEVGITPAVVVFAAAVSISIGLGVGLFPLFRMGIDSLAGRLREAGRGSTPGRERSAVRASLVVAQVTMALVLLASAALLLQSFQRLRSVDPGVDLEGVLTMELNLPWSRYRSYESVARFYEQLVERVEGLPGVTRAGLADEIPLDRTGTCSSVYPEDRANGESRAPCVPVSIATPGFLESLGISVRGRTPTWSDLNAGTGAVVVSRALAQRLWPDQEAIGRGIRGNGPGEPYYRVVGVTEDVRYEGVENPPTEIVYFPIVPIEGAGLWGTLNPARLVVSSASDRPEELTRAIRGIVADLDPEVPIADVRTMEKVAARSMSRVTFAMALLAAAAIAALLIGAVGLYGVLSYIVGQRTNEFGIRLALGAGVDQIARLVVRRAVALAAIGIVLGVAAAVAVTRLLRSLLFEVDPADPVVLAAVAAALVLISLLASWIPARRATRVDPAISLRAD